MTPMIDVIFLLLIFFVCTASFQAAEEVLPTNLSLPGTTSETETVDPELVDLDEIIIKLFLREGRPGWRVELRGQEVDRRACRDLNEVRQVLLQIAQVRIDLPVILDAEGQVPIADVIDVYDLCRQLGLEAIRFAASGPAEATNP